MLGKVETATPSAGRLLNASAAQLPPRWFSRRRIDKSNLADRRNRRKQRRPRLAGFPGADQPTVTTAATGAIRALRRSLNDYNYRHGSPRKCLPILPGRYAGFAILEHDFPTLHWDCLLEDGDVLLTWRLSSPPESAAVLDALKTFDHRRLYLDYEGPVSGDRGRVTRWDGGTFEWEGGRRIELRCVSAECGCRVSCDWNAWKRRSIAESSGPMRPAQYSMGRRASPGRRNNESSETDSGDRPRIVSDPCFICIPCNNRVGCG